MELASVSQDGEELAPDISVSVRHEPAGLRGEFQWDHEWKTEDGIPTISLAKLGQGFLLRFPSLADFLISPDGREIDAQVPSGVGEATFRHLLLDQVLPRVLSHRGMLVVHGAAVSIDGKAVVFLGETGEGKSTLAASFSSAGFPLLTDDGLVLRLIEDRVMCLAGYPGLRLGPGSLSKVLPGSTVGFPMAQYSGKTRVEAPGGFVPGEQELGGIYVLSSRRSVAEEDPLALSRLSPMGACMELVRHSFQLDVLDTSRAGEVMEASGKVSEHTPAFVLHYVRKFKLLSEVVATIVDQQQQRA